MARIASSFYMCANTSHRLPQGSLPAAAKQPYKAHTTDIPSAITGLTNALPSHWHRIHSHNHASPFLYYHLRPTGRSSGRLPLTDNPYIPRDNIMSCYKPALPHAAHPVATPGLVTRILYIGALIAAGSPAFADTVTVGTVSELQNAVASANSSGGSKTILLKDGTYTLTNTLYINSPNVSISGQSGARDKVIIQGDAMSAGASVGNLLRVAASTFLLSNVTLQKSGWHLIQIAGETNADSPTIRNTVFRDAYQQMLKVSVDTTNPNVTSNNGLVENSLFEYTAGIGPQYYIGGIDAHGSKNWLVRNNTFRSIISPNTAVAEFAVHFWDGSANNTVEKNLIINCDRGIGYGLSGAIINTGGIIRNNMIYHAANTGQFADVSIALAESPGTQVYNNTVFMENSFSWGIEYRFGSTTNVLVLNNLANKPIMNRDGASGTISTNVTNASGAWFVKPASGNLHLASAITSVVAAGQAISGLTDDFDGQPRTAATGIDIGADQFAAPSALLPATNLRVVSP